MAVARVTVTVKAKQPQQSELRYRVKGGIALLSVSRDIRLLDHAVASVLKQVVGLHDAAERISWVISGVVSIRPPGDEGEYLPAVAAVDTPVLKR